ncbi:NF038122 family metalloprotease [Chamaesiphon sp. OTE_8_metabat_110]|uniref:NF038122 family metalloprotease n=1 Tax=Chamaesiphon sp. OTE_8_metabat_110 TaxID=2964696 RepID=UPI00286CA52B|nr:NF038122 family metalloprotease [Chamaesiphon sp. OTE_8_metabat_110]
MKIQIVKLKQLAVMTGIALSGIGGSGAITPANALTFNFNPSAATSQQAIDGFTKAGEFWSSLFTDNVTINIDIDYSRLDPGVLAQAGSTTQNFSYAQVYAALSGDKTSADDNTVVSNLSTNAALSRLINRTSNNPNGSGSDLPYVYTAGTNSNTMELTNANAKALGLATTVFSDASISFSTLFTFDFDRSDGINGNSYDFIGVATHEIGHALGFISGVDVLDYNSPTVANPNNGPFLDSQFTSVNPLDLFRYSAQSKALGTIDFTADERDKYFSLDGGQTKIASFSTGVTFGDGRQASHWKDSSDFRITPELGIMNPTFSNGQLGEITENDLRAFDVIGWNRVSATATAVPEPADFIGTAIGAVFGFKLIQKRRQQRAKSTTKTI